MTVHELKCHPDEFAAIRRGEKTFEYRANDRDFHAGDEILLREWLPGDEGYTGEVERRLITHILRGGAFGLPDSRCILSLGQAWTPVSERPLLLDGYNSTEYLWLRTVQENGRGLIGLGFAVQKSDGLHWYWADKQPCQPTHYCSVESPLFVESEVADATQ